MQNYSQRLLLQLSLVEEKIPFVILNKIVINKIIIKIILNKIIVNIITIQ